MLITYANSLDPDQARQKWARKNNLLLVREWIEKSIPRKHRDAKQWSSGIGLSIPTLVNVYVDLLAFTRIAGTS